MLPADSQRGRWKCPRCGETMASELNICWSCGSDRRPMLDPAVPETADSSGPGPHLAVEEPPKQSESTSALSQPGSLELWLEAGVVMAIYLLSAYYGSIAAAFWPEEFRREREYSIPWSLSVLISDLPVAALVLLLIWKSKESWSSFGLGRPRWAEDGLTAFLLCAIVWGAESLFEGMATALLGESRMAWPTDWKPESFRPAGFSHGVLAITAVVISSSVQELVMRAYLVPRFERLLGSAARSILLTSSLFAAYHAYQGLGGVLSSMVFGLLYGTAFWSLGRFWPVAVAHSFHNLLVLASNRCP